MCHSHLKPLSFQAPRVSVSALPMAGRHSTGEPLSAAQAAAARPGSWLSAGEARGVRILVQPGARGAWALWEAVALGVSRDGAVVCGGYSLRHSTGGNAVPQTSLSLCRGARALQAPRRAGNGPRDNAARTPLRVWLTASLLAKGVVQSQGSCEISFASCFCYPKSTG